MTCVFSTLTPLIFSGIFYASNGKYPVAYIDALYNSVSAMTVCGLATVNLSQLTAWQQVLLFIQMCIGNPVCSLASGTRDMSLTLAQGHCVVGDGVHQEVVIHSVCVSGIHS
jgi:Trk-type K+ transport system membrane component